MNQEERYQQERLSSLQHQVDIGIKVMGYLYLSNAGSIIALIGYMGQKQSSLPCCWKVPVFFFLLGLILAIGVGACAYFYQAQVTQYTNRCLKWIQEATDSLYVPSTSTLMIGMICGILSTLCFILGAYIILFTF